MNDDLYDRVLGCIIGHTIGDAYGAVVEFRDADEVRKTAGGDWVGEFLPYRENQHTHTLGVWRKAPPRGTGTDDTRNNHIFLECVVRNGGEIDSRRLAVEYFERYRDRASYYPGCEELSERYLRGAARFARAYLGMNGPGDPPASVTLARGNSFPSLGGLISLAFAGLLHPGDPEHAYETAFELDYRDIGYARDATGILAAMVSVASGGAENARELVKVGLDTNPFTYGRCLMAERIEGFLKIADEAESDRALVDALAREVGHLHPFDPIDVLGVPVAGLYFTDGDPHRTIAIAANDRDLDEHGNLLRLRDVDCTAGVAGALVGALRGAGAFPRDWKEDVVNANREVYGIDLQANARRFYEAVHGGVGGADPEKGA
jgi:ADP-ribosylglycohydrolase